MMRQPITLFFITMIGITIPAFSYADENIPHTHHKILLLKIDMLPPVDINRATVISLKTLKGIGEKRAGEIIEYRETNGDFESTDALAKVSGIGKKGLVTLLKNNPGRVIVTSEK